MAMNLSSPRERAIMYDEKDISEPSFGFGRGGENWFGFLFRIPTWTGSPRTTSEEGTLHWVPVADVLAGAVPMWESDRHFLPLIFADNPRPFHGVMPFAQGRAVSWSYTI